MLSSLSSFSAADLAATMPEYCDGFVPLQGTVAGAWTVMRILFALSFSPVIGGQLAVSLSRATH